MSDYIFMLESHLTPAQRAVVRQVSQAASQAGVNLFLTGGALRDTLAGFPVRDLDFAVEGDALNLARSIARESGARIVTADTHLCSAELVFPNGITAEIAMTRSERYPKPGARPEVARATIHEDLMRRDFTVNSIALSLTPASRGLLIDPCNGAGDIEHRELRANTNHSLYDDPVRLLRLIRFRVRLGFAVEERTQRQYQSAREAGLEKAISAKALSLELRKIAEEIRAGEVLAELEKEGLLQLVSSALQGPRLNLPSFEKLAQVRQLIPQGISLNGDLFGLFMFLLTEKLPAGERAELIRRLRLSKAEVENWQGLPARARRLEKKLQDPELRRASALFATLQQAALEEILYLYLRSPQRLVRDRIRNYIEKHLYVALAVTDREVTALTGKQPGTPEFERLRTEIIAARLDGKKWRPAEETTVESALAAAGRSAKARRSGTGGVSAASRVRSVRVRSAAR